jgi:hypothetical protein
MSHHHPDHQLRVSSCLDNGEHFHIVVTDPATEHLIDFEVLPLPITIGSLQGALSALSERHLLRLAADDQDSVWLPSENELYAHCVPEDGTVLVFDPRGQSHAPVVEVDEPVVLDDSDAQEREAAREEEARAERAAIEAQRHRETAERLVPIMHFYTDLSPIATTSTASAWAGRDVAPGPAGHPAEGQRPQAARRPAGAALDRADDR